jgi:hypothetical protein
VPRGLVHGHGMQLAEVDGPESSWSVAGTALPERGRPHRVGARAACRHFPRDTGINDPDRAARADMSRPEPEITFVRTEADMGVEAHDRVEPTPSERSLRESVSAHSSP